MIRLVLAGAVLGCAACTSVEVVPDRFYRLAPAIAEVAEGKTARGRLQLRVDDFSVAPHLQSDRIVSVIDCRLTGKLTRKQTCLKKCLR